MNTESESQSFKSAMMEAIMKFGENANKALNPEAKPKDTITTISDIDFNEKVSDSTERSRRERVLYHFQKLYKEHRSIPSLLKGFFGSSASFTFTD